MNVLLGHIEHAKTLLNLHYLDVDVEGYQFYIQEQRVMKLAIHGRTTLGPLLESNTLTYLSPDEADLHLEDVQSYRTKYGGDSCTSLQYVDLLLCKLLKMTLTSNETLLIDIARKENIEILEPDNLFAMIENKGKKAI